MPKIPSRYTRGTAPPILASMNNGQEKPPTRVDDTLVVGEKKPAEKPETTLPR
jgi:hypothetical protein